MGVRVRQVCLQKDDRRDPCGDANVLYLDNDSTLVLILYYNLARCYYWGKLGEGYKDCSVSFLI